MERPEITRERLGDMLVAASLITKGQLDEALAVQQKSGIRIGKQLVELGYVTEVQVTQILSNQLSVPWVALDRVEFSVQLLSLVPGELAERFTVMPIYVRRVRDQGETLYVAMDDPTDEDAIRLVATAARLPVRPMIASPTDIRRAVDARYFGGDDSAPMQQLPTLEAARSPEPPARAAEPVRAPPETARTTQEMARATQETARASRVKPPPPPARVSRPEGLVPLEQYEAPSQPPQSAAKGRTLTLLDGTTISLPLPGRSASHAEVTLVRHVVKAVRSACADLGIEEHPRWHDVVQALVDALTERGVKLTRKEVAEAWARRHAALPRDE